MHWSGLKYYLYARCFEFQVEGEEVVTMENGTRIQVSGDPGDDNYNSTIEITWDANGL